MKKIVLLFLSFFMFIGVMNAAEFNDPIIKTFKGDNSTNTAFTGNDVLTDVVEVDTNKYVFVGYTDSSNFTGEFASELNEDLVGKIPGGHPFVYYYNADNSWAHIYGAESNERILSATVSNDKSYIMLAGEDDDQDFGVKAAYVLKINLTTGEKINSTRYIDSSEKSAKINKIISSTDGNFIAVGIYKDSAALYKIRSTMTLAYDGKPLIIKANDSEKKLTYDAVSVTELLNKDYLVVGNKIEDGLMTRYIARYSTSGNRSLYTDTYKRKVENQEYKAVDVHATNDGGYIVLIKETSYDEFEHENGTNIVLERYDKNNKLLWTNRKLIEGSRTQLLSLDVNYANESLVLLSAGNTHLLYKFKDSTGSELWNKELSTSSIYVYSKAKESSTGNILLAGSSLYSGSLFDSYAKIYNSVRVQNVKVISNSYNSSKITFDALEGYEGYKIYYSTSKFGTYYEITREDDSLTEYIHTGRTTGKTYYYKVKAYKTDNNNIVESDLTFPKSVFIRPATPVVSIKKVGANSITLSWNRVSGAYGYWVYRKNSINGTARLVKKIYSGSQTTWTNYDRETGKTYYYYVKAYRKVGKSRKLSYASEIVSASPKLIAPINVKASNDNYRYVRVTYDSISGSSRYYVYRSNTENGEYVKLGYSTSTTYYDKTAEVGETYYYKVNSSRYTGGRRVYSDNYSSVVSGVRISDTIEYSLKSNNYNSVTITINKLPTATKYLVYRATSKNGKYSISKTIIASDYEGDTIVWTNTGRTFNKTYYYKIKPYYKNNGAYSTIKSVKTMLAAPLVSSNYDSSGNPRTITLTYDKVPYATGYEIYKLGLHQTSFTSIGRTKSLSYVDTLTDVEYPYLLNYTVVAYRVVNGKRVYGNESNPVRFAQ